MLIYFILSCVALAVSPGPDNIYVAVLTSRSGRIPGFSFLTGLITGCFIHTILLAFGLNELLIRHYIFFEIIKYTGVFYLLYLSYETYKSEISNFYLHKNKI